MSVSFRSAQDKVFTASLAAAKLSDAIVKALESISNPDEPIFINLPDKILESVLSFCETQSQQADPTCVSPTPDDDGCGIELTETHGEFCKKIRENDTFYEVLDAANFLGINTLVTVAAKDEVSRLVGKTPEEILQYYGVTESITDEERKAVEAAHPWVLLD